jgi:hypothetical protein
LKEKNTISDNNKLTLEVSNQLQTYSCVWSFSFGIDEWKIEVGTGIEN